MALSIPVQFLALIFAIKVVGTLRPSNFREIDYIYIYMSLTRFVLERVYGVNCIAFFNTFSVRSQKRQNSGMQRGKRTCVINLRTDSRSSADGNITFPITCILTFYLLEQRLSANAFVNITQIRPGITILISKLFDTLVIFLKAFLKVFFEEKYNRQHVHLLTASIDLSLLLLQ